MICLRLITINSPFFVFEQLVVIQRFFFSRIFIFFFKYFVYIFSFVIKTREVLFSSVLVRRLWWWLQGKARSRARLSISIVLSFSLSHPLTHSGIWSQLVQDHNSTRGKTKRKRKNYLMHIMKKNTRVLCKKTDKWFLSWILLKHNSEREMS